jgi:hypothetical protein
MATTTRAVGVKIHEYKNQSRLLIDDVISSCNYACQSTLDLCFLVPFLYLDGNLFYNLCLQCLV